MLLVKKAEHRLMLRGAQFRKEHGDWRLTCRMGVDIGREAGCEAGTSISANALGRSLTVLKWNARGLGARVECKRLGCSSAVQEAWVLGHAGAFAVNWQLRSWHLQMLARLLIQEERFGWRLGWLLGRLSDVRC